MKVCRSVCERGGLYEQCSDFIGKSYSLPRSLTEIKVRLDTNLFTYLGNYILVVLGVFVCVLYNRPAALAGGLLTLKMWDWVRSGAENAPGSTMHQFRYGAATVLSWAVMLYSNVTLAVSYALLSSITVVVLHGGVDAGELGGEKQKQKTHDMETGARSRFKRSQVSQHLRVEASRVASNARSCGDMCARAFLAQLHFTFYSFFFLFGSRLALSFVSTVKYPCPHVKSTLPLGALRRLDAPSPSFTRSPRKQNTGLGRMHLKD